MTFHVLLTGFIIAVIDRVTLLLNMLLITIRYCYPFHLSRTDVLSIRYSKEKICIDDIKVSEIFTNREPKLEKFSNVKRTLRLSNTMRNIETSLRAFTYRVTRKFDLSKNIFSLFSTKHDLVHSQSRNQHITLLPNVILHTYNIILLLSFSLPVEHPERLPLTIHFPSFTIKTNTINNTTPYSPP